MKILKKLNGLFDKVENTEASYMKALEKKEEEILKLSVDLQAKADMLKELHKETLKGTISKEAYEEERVEVEKLQAAIAEMQKEVQLIQVYENEDIHAVLEELEAERNVYSAGKRTEMRKIEMELLEAKLAYLEKMQEARAKYNEIVNPEVKIDALKIKLGMKQRSYVSGAGEVLNMIGVGGGYEPLRVEQSEVYNALAYGQLPSGLQSAVSKAREDGI
ncbi:hypothetical protein AEA09_14780 [Lysinibacillus contaminans]|uniref:Uncharacterized protein n=1 Tax=Lysinibacillus contaminans TaxID=1293441 RepID=A0ABR5JYF4_9BACI|nr:hypothetical protein [Lysinibacillus contaminans]KOS67115.1 hypothetical protein AEA09_14780 [Lysinibacillus contaminans]